MHNETEPVGRDIVSRLEHAWNAGDGDAFAEPFATDADFVTVRGEYYRTREGISHGHRAIFSTIYKGSTNRIDVLRSRALSASMILVHARAVLSVPAGPLAGEHTAVMSILIGAVDRGWEIVAFHNTFRMPTAPVRDQVILFTDYAAG
jgi:uncharacterized protein (TIGR02246 family)